MQPRQFLTNEQGERVGVVLDMATYEKLLRLETRDANLLRDLTIEQLEVLAKSQLTSDAQEQLYDLIEKKKTSALSREETKQLAGFLEQIDQLAVLKARALYTLKQNNKFHDTAH